MKSFSSFASRAALIAALASFVGAGSVEAASKTEIEFWRSVESTQHVEDYKAYLKKYPNGEFADLAQNRIELGIRPQDGVSPEALGEAAADAARFISPPSAEKALNLTFKDRRRIQAGLNALGYDTRGIDGVFGTGTRAAIREWQAANGLTRSGYLTEAQMFAITAATDAVSESAQYEVQGLNTRHTPRENVAVIVRPASF